MLIILLVPLIFGGIVQVPLALADSGTIERVSVTMAGSFKVEMFRESDGILIFSASLVGLAFILGMVMLWRRQQRVG